jgi:beta-glucanase (GH16 family)
VYFLLLSMPALLAGVGCSSSGADREPVGGGDSGPPGAGGDATLDVTTNAADAGAPEGAADAANAATDGAKAATDGANAATDAGPPQVVTDDAGTWHLVWSDEFDGPSVNTANWTVKDEIVTNSNNELENYHPANVSIANGVLVLEARQQLDVELNDAGADAGTKNYTSGAITSLGLQSFKYGRILARIKLPATPGMWPSFWMMGDDVTTVPWPACGEIDIMEAKGRLPTEVYSSLHWGGDFTSTFTFPSGSDITGWHEYILEWDATSIQYRVDYGPAYGQHPTQNPFNQAFYLKLYLAVGGLFDGNVAPLPNMPPQQMLVDYVRVYQH